MESKLLDAKRAYQREKQREWRARNKDRAREYQREYRRQYREKHAEKLKQHDDNFYMRKAEEQANDKAQ